jgi:hypothetical protein
MYGRIYAKVFGEQREAKLGPLYEEYAERILMAFYQAHQDPQYPGVRAHGLTGAVLAVQAGIVSTDEWQARDFWTSRKRWDIVAALRELIDRDFIKRTEDDTEDHTHPDQWNFRLTPQGKEYAHQLLSKGYEMDSGVSTRRMAMTKPVRIFISSTWEDLQPEREAVEKALQRMQDTTFAGMEYFGSRPETPKEASLAEVDRSHIYVGIFAHRYGSGITEAEYRRAKELGLPCLIYFKDDRVPVLPANIERDPQKTAKLEALKDELNEQHIVSFFTTSDQLATQVVTDLHNFLGREKPSERAAPSGSTYQIHIGTARGIAIGDGATVVQQGPAREEMSQLIPSQSTQTGSDQRCTDLAENIREAWSLIKLYEEQCRLAGDPKEKRRAEREIEDLRQQVAEYEAEARRLSCEEVA